MNNMNLNMMVPMMEQNNNMMNQNQANFANPMGAPDMMGQQVIHFPNPMTDQSMMNQNLAHFPNQTAGQNNNIINQNQANFNFQTTGQNNNNNLETENIFNSYSNPSNSFVFSLDSLNIYYKEDINKFYPGFSITYNKKFKRLLGEEIPNMGPEPYRDALG